MNGDIQQLTARIVSSYAANNTIAATELPLLIQTVYNALSRAGTAPVEAVPAETLKPAISIRKSVTPERLYCLECGSAQKTLRRHISAFHGMTPEEYRAKWGLSPEYPMIASNYAAQRSEMAKAFGLGRKKGAKGKKAK